MAGARDGVLGRAAAADVLADLLVRPGRDPADVLVVEGAAGTGKTGLVRELLDRRPDVDALWVSGDRSERSLPFGVAHQLARRLPGTSTVAPTTDPFLVGARLLEGLDALSSDPDTLFGSPSGTPSATDRMLAVVVDDLQWIDPGSAHALLFVLRRLQHERVVAVLVVRPHGVDHLGPSWARLLTDTARTRWVRLARTTAAATGPAAAGELTARERVVAELVGHGLTNREVADELFVSVKAVEFHLRNIFGKLDLRSRRQLRDVLDPVRPVAAPLPVRRPVPLAGRRSAVS